MIKGVIFDMDGVLVDNAHIHKRAFAEFCDGFGVKLDEDVLMEVFGCGNDVIIPKIIPAEKLKGKDLVELGDYKEQIYRDMFAKEGTHTAGLIDFLKQIRESGLKTAVGSSAPLPNVEFVLEKFKIANMFDAIVDGDMVAERKPAPDIYLLGAKKLGLEPHECVVIEDALPGVESARSAGCHVVCLATTFDKERLSQWDCDLIAKDFTQLSPEIIKGISTEC